jgi:hypothetical protein
VKLLRVLLLISLIAGCVDTEPLTLPLDQRPAWLQRDGIVMAGSWEPLIFRVRRDGRDGYDPTPRQIAGYQREHSPEMVDQLKNLGVNFIMMHCYKGAGLKAEGQSMKDAVEFAKLCRENNIRTGVYNYSGAFLWELLFKEVPQARQWVLHQENGKPYTYGRATYRYYWNRNHPEAQAYYKNIIRFAVQDIGVDLIHFDNYCLGPGCDDNSVRRFRQYLRNNFTNNELRTMGVEDISTVKPPKTGPPDNLLRRVWLEFSCQSLANSYHQMGRYARTLRKDILVECNPGGPGNRITPPIDHGRLLQGGECFWDECYSSGFVENKLRHRICTYKIARKMDNVTFIYTITPLEMAESMAFNRDCLGCICWFEYGKLVDRPGSKKPVSPDLKPFIRFFHQRRDLLRNADVVADVAVLRSFPSQAFAQPKYAKLTSNVEQFFIEERIPFQIIYDHHLKDLKSYRILVLAGCLALSDRQIEQITRFVDNGGQLCALGPLATHDRWMMPREKPALADIPPDKLIKIPYTNEFIQQFRQTFGNCLSLSVQAPIGVCAELTKQNNRRLLHLVNYHQDKTIKDIAVNLRLPPARRVKSVTLASPEHKDNIKLKFNLQDNTVDFIVPQIKTYEIAVITLE